MVRTPSLATVLLIGCFAAVTLAAAAKPAKDDQFIRPRVVAAEDIAVPEGYRVDIVAEGLNFPTGVAIDDRGRPYVVEAGYPHGDSPVLPRLVRIESGGRITPIATGTDNGPWTGIVFHNGAFYVAEGGRKEGGRILRITRSGEIATVVEKLPSVGDHHTNGPIVGPDGWLYFGQGTATNSGVVGSDNAEFGWVSQHPEFHDIPCRDVTLTGETFSTPDSRAKGKVKTAAFSPFGSRGPEDRVVRGAIPCNGAILRVRPSGREMELVAWGFRNPFGFAFDSAGTLFVTDKSYDDRGSRPVDGAGDLLWEVKFARWYGWPDYHGGRRLDEGSQRGPRLKPLLAREPSKPPEPTAIFGVRSNADGFDFSRSYAFGHVGDAFVAMFGDTAPGSAKSRADGFKIVRVEVKVGAVKDFAVNRSPKNGPASEVGGRGLERPVAARFDPSGAELYVVDFGVMTTSDHPEPRPNTGVLWRIRKPQELAYGSPQLRAISQAPPRR